MVQPDDVGVITRAIGHPTSSGLSHQDLLRTRQLIMEEVLDDQ